MLRVDIGRLVDHVSDSITGRIDEEGIIWVENLSSDDLVPFSQKAALIDWRMLHLWDYPK